MEDIILTIKGEPASKANQRRSVINNGRMMFIKSKKALDYSKSFLKQCPTLDDLLEQDLCVEMKIFYASRRPDLDESLILDLLQGRIYKNDRQVKQKIITWGLDKENPRTYIKITNIKDHDI